MKTIIQTRILHDKIRTKKIKKNNLLILYQYIPVGVGIFII